MVMQHKGKMLAASPHHQGLVVRQLVMAYQTHFVFWNRFEISEPVSCRIMKCEQKVDLLSSDNNLLDNPHNKQILAEDLCHQN